MLVNEPADIESYLRTGIDYVVSAGNIPTANASANVAAQTCQQHRIPHNVGAAYAHANGSLEPTVIPGATPCWDRRQRAVGDPLVAADARLIRTYKDPVGIIPMFPAILANYLAWEIFAFCWVPRRFAAVPSRHRPGSVYREVA